MPVSEAGLAAATAAIVELGVPWRSLGVSNGAAVRFAVELLIETEAVERVPVDGYIATTVPAPEFDLVMWQA